MTHAKTYVDKIKMILEAGDINLAEQLAVPLMSEDRYFFPLVQMAAEHIFGSLFARWRVSVNVGYLTVRIRIRRRIEVAYDDYHTEMYREEILDHGLIKALSYSALSLWNRIGRDRIERITNPK